jgi:hypothetical protein
MYFLLCPTTCFFFFLSFLNNTDDRGGEMFVFLYLFHLLSIIRMKVNLHDIEPVIFIPLFLRD